MGVLTPMRNATAAKPAFPVRLGECHKDGWRDQPGFPCYRWFWFEEGQYIPTIKCVCGGSYPRLPPPGLSKRVVHDILADPIYIKKAAGQAVVERGLPHSKIKIVQNTDELANDPMTTLVTKTILDMVEQHHPTTSNVTVTLSPVWPAQTTAGGGIEVMSRDDSETLAHVGVVFFIIGVIFLVLGIAGLKFRNKRTRRAEIERQRHTVGAQQDCAWCKGDGKE